MRYIITIAINTIKFYHGFYDSIKLHSGAKEYLHAMHLKKDKEIIIKKLYLQLFKAGDEFRCTDMGMVQNGKCH